MATCHDNPRTGTIGCGATYAGRQQHSVARVPWSDHPDGRAHLTFSTENNADMCWRGDTMHHPATVATKTGEPRLVADERGTWRQPGDPRWRREPAA